MIEQFAINFSKLVKTYSFGSTSFLGKKLKDKFYVAHVIYLTTVRLEIKSILDTFIKCYKTVPDINIFLKVSKSSYWIFNHLIFIQRVKVHAHLECKLIFSSQPRTLYCRVYFNDVHYNQHISRSERLYRRVSALRHQHARRTQSFRSRRREVWERDRRSSLHQSSPTSWADSDQTEKSDINIRCSIFMNSD